MTQPCPFCNYQLGSGAYCGNCMAHRCTGSGIPDAALDDKMLGGKRPQRETVGFGWNKAIQQMYGPAPKEESMTTNVAETIPDVYRVNGILYRRVDSPDIRAHYDAVYLAALGGVSAHIEEVTAVICKTADAVALESVRTHAARMAELEALIGALAWVKTT